MDTTTSGFICTVAALTWAMLVREESLEIILHRKSVKRLREKPSWYYCRTHPLLNYLLEVQLRKIRPFITVAVGASLPSLCFSCLSACCFSAESRTNRMAVTHLLLQSLRWEPVLFYFIIHFYGEIIQVKEAKINQRKGCCQLIQGSLSYWTYHRS